MHVGLLVVDCWVPGSHSLKDKRRALQSVVTRLKRSFNIAVCETDYQDQWQRARLAVVTVNTDAHMIERAFGLIGEFVERSRDLEVLSTDSELLL